ncbi:MAG: pyruvate kinase [Clostridia bacterium]|nr:pyruvate kinase [Clostridia bacterium]
MRKTKIVCTMGPACADEETLIGLVKAGMNVARLNFSHGTHADHMAHIERIRAVRKKLNAPVAILLDTKGPEYRIRHFADGRIYLNEGDIFTFTTREIDGDSSQVSVNYKDLARELEAGDRILLNNGLLAFEVLDTTDTDIRCRVLTGGELSNNKSMSFPDKVLHQPYLSEQDKRDLLFGVQNDVDFVACSFVSCRDDLLDVKAYLKEINADERVELIAKIENRAGIDNIEEICAECSGIMIGRGDLGVEIPLEELPAIQKKLITQCRMMGKRVITATEMLESMIHNPRPTRAEASDVANAVYDGTSALMLSGETAAGQYPVLAVDTMARIAEQTEKSINYQKRFYSASFEIRNTVDAVSHATCALSMDVKAKAIVVCTLSGMTARMVSRFRSPVDILGLTTDEKSLRKLALSWGVTPRLCDHFESTDVLFYTGKHIAADTFGLSSGDQIVITGGMTNGRSGNTNLLKIDRI